MDQSVRENGWRVANHLPSASAVLRDPVQTGRVRIVDAYYGLGDGEAEFMA